MSKLAVVGCEASGKTVFMAALADYYQPRPGAEDRPCLVPENPEANRFAAYLKRQMRVLRQWPQATNPGQTLKTAWTMRRAGKVLADVEMIEFGGETFRAAFREGAETAEHDAAEHELMAYLSEADYIVLLVNLREIFRDPGTLSAEEFDRETEAQWVTRGLIEFVHERLPKADLVIGLTCADRYRDQLTLAGGGAAAFAAYWPTIRAVCPDAPVFEVASVSAVDAAEQPAENYVTDGVAPVMEGFLKKARASKSRPAPRVAKSVPTVEAAVAPAATMAVSDTSAPVAGNRRLGMQLALLALLVAVAGYAIYSCLVPVCKPALTPVSAKPVPAKTAPAAQPTATSPKQAPKLDAAAKSAEKPVVEEPAKPDPGKVLANLEQALAAERVEEAAAALETLDGLAATLSASEKKRLVQARAFQANLAAALDGDIAAQNSLAAAYYNGGAFVTRDYAKALLWYKLSAEAGDAAAQMCLGVMYEEGQGAEKNAARAEAWYRKAAMNGAADAMYHMGVTAAAAQTPDKTAEANDWFRKAKAAGTGITNVDAWIQATEAK